MRRVTTILAGIALAVLSHGSASAAGPPVLVRWDAGSGQVTALPGGGVVVTRETAYIAFRPDGRRRWVARFADQGTWGPPLPHPVATGPRTLRLTGFEVVYGPHGRARVTPSSGCVPGVWVQPSFPGMSLAVCDLIGAPR